MKRKLTVWAPLALAVLITAPAAAAPSPSLPPGVTAQKSEEGLTLATSDGAPLYRLDLDRIAKRRKDAAKIGRQRCEGICDRLWRPVAAPKDFKAEGDWSVTEQLWGQQLAYKGDLLYTITPENLQEAAKLQVVPPYFTSYSAKPTSMVDGVPVATLYWHKVLYQPPAPKIQPPAGIGLRWEKTAYVFTDAENRRLYAPKSGAACSEDCSGLTPLPAPLAARPVGDWRPVEADSGARYWAYKGRIAHRAADATTEAPAGDWRPLDVR